MPTNPTTISTGSKGGIRRWTSASSANRVSTACSSALARGALSGLPPQRPRLSNACPASGRCDWCGSRRWTWISRGGPRSATRSSRPRSIGERPTDASTGGDARLDPQRRRACEPPSALVPRFSYRGESSRRRAADPYDAGFLRSVGLHIVRNAAPLPSGVAGERPGLCGCGHMREQHSKELKPSATSTWDPS